MEPSITAIVLAAGKGTRMRSKRAKVLHEVFFQPMIHHVLHAINQASINHCAVIVGHQRQEVMAALDGFSVTAVLQEEQLGTGHAVLCAEQACTGADMVMILCADTPLIGAATLRDMISLYRHRQADLTLMTTLLDQPFGYGRILCDEQGAVLAIVEEKDATEEQRQIREVNAGIYLVDKKVLFDTLRRVGTDNSQGEMYLTDIIAIANQMGRNVQKFLHPEAIDVLGVNSRIELAQAQATLQCRHNHSHMLAGVTLYAPETTLIAPGCVIGQDTHLQGNTRIDGGTTIGTNCHIDRGCVLHACQIGDNVSIGANTVLEHCTIAENSFVPPLTYRRDT